MSATVRAGGRRWSPDTEIVEKRVKISTRAAGWIDRVVALIEASRLPPGRLRFTGAELLYSSPAEGGVDLSWYEEWQRRSTESPAEWVDAVHWLRRAAAADEADALALFRKVARLPGCEYAVGGDWRTSLPRSRGHAAHHHNALGAPQHLTWFGSVVRRWFGDRLFAVRGAEVWREGDGAFLRIGKTIADFDAASGRAVEEQLNPRAFWDPERHPGARDISHYEHPDWSGSR